MNVLQYVLAVLIGAFVGMVMAGSANSMSTRIYNSTLTHDVILVVVPGGIGLVNRVVEPLELMPQARQLALNMLSSVPDMLVAYKKLIDDGFTMNLADGLQLERQQSKVWNKKVSSQQIVQRRIYVLQRWQAQASEA